MYRPTGYLLRELAVNFKYAVVPVLKEAGSPPSGWVGIPYAVLHYRHPIRGLGRLDNLKTSRVVQHRRPSIVEQPQPVGLDTEDFVVLAYTERGIACAIGRYGRYKSDSHSYLHNCHVLAADRFQHR